MSSAYLDASVVIPLLVIEQATAAANRFVHQWGGTLAIGEFAAAEVASGIARLFRMRLLDRADATSRLEDFDVWRAMTSMAVELYDSDMRLASTLVRRFDLKLRAPDALHLAVCRRLDMTLVTLDERLAQAALAMGVAVLVPQTGET